MKELKQFIIENKNWTKIFAQSNDDYIKSLANSLIKETDFLPRNVKNSQRGWHIVNDIYKIPLCEHCQLNFVKFDLPLKKYYSYCSRKCSTNSITSKEKLKETSRMKYGTDFPNQNIEIRSQQIETNLKNYGTHCTLLNENVQNKIKKTNIQRYGTPITTDTDNFKKKRNDTMLERYGTEHALQNERSFEKFENTMTDRYGTKYALSNDEIYSKMLDNNLIKHNKKYSQQFHISEDSLNKLSSYDWIKHKHHDEEMSIIRIANELDVSSTTVHNRLKEHGIEIRYYGTSKEEIEIQEFLEQNGFDIICNDRTIIAPQELDIFIPSKNIAIEFCGLFWHSDARKPNDYHKLKFERCKQLGIKLITIFGNEWYYEEELTKIKILNIINKSVSFDSDIVVNDLRWDTTDILLELGYTETEYVPEDYMFTDGINDLWDKTIDTECDRKIYKIWDCGKTIFKKT